MTAAWLSSDIIKWTVATLAVPVTLGFLSYQYDKASSARQAAEARFRLYTEILSRREDTDTALRKAILDKALGSMKGAQENFGDRLTALELLAVNFHDSLNLRPLLAETERSIANSRHSTERKNALRRRLYDILGDIKPVNSGCLKWLVTSGTALSIWQSCSAGHRSFSTRSLRLPTPIP